MVKWIEPHYIKPWGGLCLKCGMWKSQHRPWPILVEQRDQLSNRNLPTSDEDNKEEL